MKEANYLLSQSNCAIKIKYKGFTSYKSDLHSFVKLNLKLVSETNDYFRKIRLKEEIIRFYDNFDTASKAPVNTKID